MYQLFWFKYYIDNKEICKKKKGWGILRLGWPTKIERFKMNFKNIIFLVKKYWDYLNVK